MEMSINGAKYLAQFELPILGTVNLTQTVVVSWLVMAIITALCVWLGSGLKVTGISRKQAVAEMAVTSLVKFVHDNMGTGFDHYIPLVGTIFVTSVVSNLISLLGIWSPTADLMTELGWALVVFVLITYHKIKSSGIGGYLKGFLDPIFVMAPINVMSELFTPISMACRHFGNILSGTVISALIYGALTSASYGLMRLLGSSIFAALGTAGIGLALFFFARAKEKKGWKILGIILIVLSILALFSLVGNQAAVDIPTITEFYIDWFGGRIQASFFCQMNLQGLTILAAVGSVIAGIVMFFLGRARKKKLLNNLGIILTVLGVLALISLVGIQFPWLTVGIPAITSFYFDWFGGCIQAFIFCTLTTIFIKQAAG